MRQIGRNKAAGRSWTSSILLVASAALAFFWVETFVVGFLEADNGYSHVEHAISLLTLADPPLGLLHRVSFVVLALAALAFAYLVVVWYQKNVWAKRLFVVFLVLHAIGRAAEGFFLWNPDSPGSIPSLLHQSLGMLGVVAMIPIPFLASMIAKGGQASSHLYRASLAFGIIFLGLFVVGVVLSLLPLGLGQRLGFLIWYGWLVYFGFSSRKKGRTSV